MRRQANRLSGLTTLDDRTYESKRLKGCKGSRNSDRIAQLSLPARVTESKSARMVQAGARQESERQRLETGSIQVLRPVCLPCSRTRANRSNRSAALMSCQPVAWLRKANPQNVPSAPPDFAMMDQAMVEFEGEFLRA